MVAQLLPIHAGRQDLAGIHAAGEQPRDLPAAAHPLKQWKLSPIDKASLDKWDEYTRAKEAMFFETDTADSPCAT